MSDDKRKASEFKFISRCRVLSKIAEGGMGTVYLAEQMGETGFAKTVALKVIRHEHLDNPQAVDMFIGEARLTADLVHQNILQVYNLGQVKDVYFIVMEFLHGLTLTQFMARHLRQQRLPPPDVAAFLISRVCRGLHYAHTKLDRLGRPLNVVHRDVTPSNIMIDYRGVCKLGDFGIAKALTQNMPEEGRKVMGKLRYMCPEQVAGQKTDPRSDLFSLGLVFHELLTGHPVFETRDAKVIVGRLQNFTPPDPRALQPGIPDELAEILMRALAHDPGDRYQTGKEFGDALEHYMYHDRYGYTNEKLAAYIQEVFPDAETKRIVKDGEKEEKNGQEDGE